MKDYQQGLNLTLYRNIVVQVRNKIRGSNLVSSESSTLYFMHKIV